MESNNQGISDISTAQKINHQLLNNTNNGNCFKYFPQPVFLLRQNMELIEANKQGDTAIEKSWVGVSANHKLHFNCQENDQHVQDIISKLVFQVDSVSSERFILRTIDLQHRVFTLALESPNQHSNLVLSIHNDLSMSDSRMQSLARAFRFTPSESNVIKMMIQGLKPKEIAYELDISLNTVRSHLRTLYAKMHVRSYNDALTQAIRLVC